MPFLVSVALCLPSSSPEKYIKILTTSPKLVVVLKDVLIDNYGPATQQCLSPFCKLFYAHEVSSQATVTVFFFF